MVRISPSVLAADFSKLGDEVKSIADAGADLVHLDVMDGIFVPNISFGFPVIGALRGKYDIPFDVHLMIDRPERYIERFLDAGAEYLTFHVEATDKSEEILKTIRARGCRAAISVKPKTPVETVFPLLDLCDMVLIMTVEPGFGGQSLIPETVDKIRVLKEEITRRSLSVEIEADGGINGKNAPDLIAAGCDILVAGSSVFRAADRRAAIDSLRIG